MKRRNFLRTCVVAPLAGLLPATKGKNTPVIEPKTGKVARQDLSAFGTYIQNPNYRMFFDRVLNQEEINLLWQKPFCMFKKPTEAMWIKPNKT